jgi:Flp pilus assembly pilin Flp
VRRGQNTVEYGLLLALVAILVLAGGYAFGATLQAWFQTILDVILAFGHGVPGH